MTSGAPDRPSWLPALPPQRRGRQRRARIVAAARELIDAHGPHGPGISIRGICERARASTASLYHYFPDLEAVVAAVATEYMDGLIEVLASAVADPAPGAPALLDRLVEAYRGYFSAHPGLRELWFDRRASPTVIRIHQFYRDHLAAELATALERYTTVPGTVLDHAIMVTMTGALWELAFNLAPEGDPTVIQRIRQVSRDYWERQFGVDMTANSGDPQLALPPGPPRSGSA